MTASPIPTPSGALSPRVDIVVPVFNESAELEASVRRLRAFLDDVFPFEAQVTIVDNASTDGTWAIAERLEADLPGVAAIHLSAKGRGRALRAAWSASSADVVAYMDVDLSTDLGALLPLVAPLISGHSDVAIGSRLSNGSRVLRGAKRELISRLYNATLHLVLGTRFRDAQCGFKALRREDARALLPFVLDEEWFFDTELLVLAERSGLRIAEVPVDWADDPDSRVHVASTAVADLCGMWRLWRAPTAAADLVAARGRARSDWLDELARFAGVGALSSVSYLLAFLGLRLLVPPLVANLLALGLTSAANLTAHHRVTFARRPPFSRRSVLLGAWMAFSTSVAFTTATLSAALAFGARGALVELGALALGNAAAALVRFAVLRAVTYRHYLGIDPLGSLRQ